MGSDGSAYKYQFKMLMEGIKVPFKSAMISCTPSGVEMNIVVNPTDKVFDLKPKTFINVFYRDWYGPSKSWRLLGEGYFSAFAKSDMAEGNRSVSLVCRDFRMDIRKTPSSLVYTNDQKFPYGLGHLYHTAGIKQRYSVINKFKKSYTVEPRNYGGQLNSYAYMLNFIAGSASGDDDKIIESKGGIWGDGRFFLDAFARGLWAEAKGLTSYAKFINSRVRVDKRMVIPDNESGYSFFSKDYLNIFGKSAIGGNSIFTTVEAAIMRLAGIFQSRPYSCSTPNLVDAKDAISDRVYDFLVRKQPKEFGPPYLINQCMILPPLNFTAPPNCNIFFPCLYNRIEWSHDYDSDITRGYYKHIDLFGGQTPKSFAKRVSEVPNSLFDNKTKYGNNPPITIEERYKGVKIKYGNVEYGVASKNMIKSAIRLLMENYDEYAKKIKSLKSKDLQKLKKKYDEARLKENVDTKELNKAKNKLEKAYSAKLVKGTINLRPSVYDVLDRHAIFKFLNARFSGRQISILSDFNPYPVCGFPGLVMADDNRNTFKTLRTLIGMVQVIKHTITAEGEASTAVIMNNIRFVSEPTDIDDIGNPLFMEDTVRNDAEIDPKTVEYKDSNYSIPAGIPKTKIESTTNESDKYDWKLNSEIVERKWAKDILLISKEGRQEGRSNLNFMDEIYTPNRIMNFYAKILKQPALSHFMISPYQKSDNTRSYFIFNSIHEAVDHLMTTQYMKDYESALEYVKRPVVTEEEYFFGILQTSYEDIPNEVEREQFPGLNRLYKTKIKAADFDPLANRDEYFGVTTQLYLDELENKLDIEPGGFSSILEKKPITPFIRERRAAVDNYRAQVTKYVNTTR